MARQRDPDIPPWIGLVRFPGVVEVIAALHNYGPATFANLRAYVEVDGSGQVTARALRRLAAWQMCRRETTGTWDEPSRTATYELTAYGQEWADLMVTWSTVVALMPAHLRERPRPFLD